MRSASRRKRSPMAGGQVRVASRDPIVSSERGRPSSVTGTRSTVSALVAPARVHTRTAPRPSGSPATFSNVAWSAPSASPICCSIASSVRSTSRGPSPMMVEAKRSGNTLSLWSIASTAGRGSSSCVTFGAKDVPDRNIVRVRNNRARIAPHRAPAHDATHHDRPRLPTAPRSIPWPPAANPISRADVRMTPHHML